MKLLKLNVGVPSSKDIATSGRVLDRANVFSCTLFGLEQVCNS